MPSNYTEHYQLNQWERSDKVLMEDFNADNAKIDGAIKAQADGLAAEVSARTALAALTAKKGNCRIETMSYTGTDKCGEEHPTVLTFSAQPTFFLVFGKYAFIFGQNGAPVVSLFNGGYSYDSNYLTTTWNGNSVSFYGDTPTKQANREFIYYVVAFYSEDKK